jgi:putative membrane protein insertion efficiency factor
MKRALLFLIRLYQLTLSSIMGTQCRFQPTCSYYAAEAVRRFGAGKGLILGIRRIARCHPWAKGGVDPVPESFSHPSFPSPRTYGERQGEGNGGAEC